jgi:hypothetical protein
MPEGIAVSTRDFAAGGLTMHYTCVHAQSMRSEQKQIVVHCPRFQVLRQVCGVHDARCVWL